MPCWCSHQVLIDNLGRLRLAIFEAYAKTCHGDLGQPVQIALGRYGKIPEQCTSRRRKSERQDRIGK